MTRERQIAIARKIVRDGIEAEVRRLEPTVFRDMGMSDATAIKDLVQGIANATQFVAFINIVEVDLWSKSR